MSRFRLSQEAQDDLAAIQTYLVKQGGTRLARKVNAEIVQAIRRLAENPGMGHDRPDLSDEPVKFWSVYAYMIAYDPAAQPLGVARILHGAQDLAAMFKQRPPRMTPSRM